MKTWQVAVGSVTLVALAIGAFVWWGSRPTVDPVLEPSPRDSVVIATPPGHRVIAQALANGLATPLGASATITGIRTWSGGHTRDGGAVSGFETSFVGTLQGATSRRYSDFFGSIGVDRGEPGYQVYITLVDFDYTSRDLGKLGAADRERVRLMLVSLLTASGVAQDYGLVEPSGLRFDGYSVDARVPAWSKEATPVLVGIGFADGLVPADMSVRTNNPARKR